MNIKIITSIKQIINKIYLQSFVFIYLLYILFNKGVAYSYLTELIIIIGIILTFSINKNKLIIELNTNYACLLFFLFVGLIYFIYGLYNFKIKGVIQDSLFFLYLSNVFILTTFLEYYNKKCQSQKYKSQIMIFKGRRETNLKT